MSCMVHAMATPPVVMISHLMWHTVAYHNWVALTPSETIFWEKWSILEKWLILTKIEYNVADIFDGGLS
jgi:hypothetical protein